MEGYLDAVALHQAGITNTVATGGTAMAHYLANLRRTTHNITIAFDNDEGGKAALARIHEDTVDIDPDLNVRIGILPEGADPADLIAQGQTDVLRRALDQAAPSVIYKIDRTLDRYNLDEPESKWRAIRDVTATVVGVTNPDARKAAVDHLTERFDWDPDVHHEDLDTYITRSAAFDQPRSGLPR